MIKKWYQLTESGKVKRLNRVCHIIDDECLTIEFWQAYDRKDYDNARKILKQTNEYGNKLGYNRHKYDDVTALLL